jgi:hypothetical protein
MKSIPLSNATRRMGAPKDWDHETMGICHTLEICDRDGWMISAWQPTQQELERINAGQPIFLGIQGHDMHPVVSIEVGKS